MKSARKFITIFSIILNIFLLYQIIYINTRYDFFVDKEQKRKIDTFIEIATGSEIGVSQYIRKWEQPVKIWIKSDSLYQEQIDFLKLKIEEINEIKPKYLKIELVDDSSACNSVFTICRYENLKEVSPELISRITPNFAGWTNFNFRKYKIYKSQIFINTSKSMTMQKNAILEELVQSLGLCQDILNDKESLFYENKNKEGLICQTINEKDHKIIELLYHPKIKPGFDRYEIEKVLRKVMD